MSTPNADHYRGKHNGRDGFPLVAFDALGYTTIEPLTFLHGRPWDDIALGYIHALRPSRIRVATDSVQLDAQAWRVTVWLKADGKTIKKISQEVTVGLPEGIENGHELEIAANEGKGLRRLPVADWLRPYTVGSFIISEEYKQALEAIVKKDPEIFRRWQADRKCAVHDSHGAHCPELPVWEVQMEHSERAVPLCEKCYQNVKAGAYGPQARLVDATRIDPLPANSP